MSADEKLMNDGARSFGLLLAELFKYITEMLNKQKPFEKVLLEESDKALDKYIYDIQEEIKKLESYNDGSYDERLRLLNDQFKDATELHALVKSSSHLFGKDKDFHNLTSVERIKVIETIRDVRDFMEGKDFKYKSGILRNSKNLNKVLNFYLNHEKKMEILPDKEVDIDPSKELSSLTLSNENLLEMVDYKRLEQGNKYIEQGDKYIEGRDILPLVVAGNVVLVFPPSALYLEDKMSPLYQDMGSKLESANRAFEDNKLLLIDQPLSVYQANLNLLNSNEFSSVPINEFTRFGIENTREELNQVNSLEVLQTVDFFGKTIDLDSLYLPMESIENESYSFEIEESFEFDMSQNSESE
jgi:hypothetical protein